MRKLRTVSIVFISILACLILQTSVLPSLALGGISPNLMIIAATSYGFMFGDRKGLAIGFVCGLLCDICFGPLIGFRAGVYAAVGFLSGKFQKVLYVEDLAFPMSLIALCDFMSGFLTYVFIFMLQNRLFFRTFLTKRMLPEMVYTVIAAVFLYPILRLLYDRFMRERRQSSFIQELEQNQNV